MMTYCEQRIADNFYFLILVSLGENFCSFPVKKVFLVKTR